MTNFSNTNPAVLAIAASLCGWSKTVDIKPDGTLDWFGADGYPTEQQLLDAIPAAQIKYDNLLALGYVSETDYQHKRAAEYPPVADYLDGVVKGDQAQIDAYIAACQAVKDKYPKPE